MLCALLPPSFAYPLFFFFLIDCLFVLSFVALTFVFPFFSETAVFYLNNSCSSVTFHSFFSNLSWMLDGEVVPESEIEEVRRYCVGRNVGAVCVE